MYFSKKNTFCNGCGQIDFVNDLIYIECITYIYISIHCKSLLKEENIYNVPS